MSVAEPSRGQRWIYRKNFVVEITRPDGVCGAVLVVNPKLTNYRVGDSLNSWSIPENGWKFLQGQEHPEELNLE